MTLRDLIRAETAAIRDGLRKIALAKKGTTLMLQWLLRAVGAMRADQRLICVKAWCPVYQDGVWLGPLLLVERNGWRHTIRRIYNKEQ